MIRTIKWLFKILFSPLTLLLKLLSSFSLKHAGENAKRRRQAQKLASTMLNEFRRLGLSRRAEGSTRKKRKKRHVRWEYPLLMTRDELWCPVDLKKLPMGVTSNMLRDEDVIQSLEDRVHGSVRVDYLASGKLCIVTRLGGSKFPAVLSINSCEVPMDAPALSFPWGVNADGEKCFGNLVDLKHLLVVGATGGGKTTFQHALITTLISRNSVDDLELWLIDMKRSEFSLYRSLVDKKGDSGIVRHIAVEPEHAVEVLDLAYKEIVRRNQFMEQFGVTNIADLARTTGQRMRRIVLICDEFAMLTTDKTKVGKHNIGSWSTLLMTRIAALGRSAGVSIIIATQFVSKDVLSSMIRANFENRLTFSCADWRQSQLVIETSEADGLPKGRAILRQEGRTYEYQTCYITPNQVRLEVSRIKEYGPDGGLGDDAELTRFVKDAKLLLSVACDQLQGDFARTKLLALQGVRGIISQERFNEVAQRLERDGVLAPGRSNKPRRVERAFFGRPGLLDTLYGLQTGQTTEPTAESRDALLLDAAAMPLEHTEDQNDSEGSMLSVVGGLQKPGSMALEGEVLDPDDPELDLPGNGNWAILDCSVDLPDDPEPPAPKPKRKRGKTKD